MYFLCSFFLGLAIAQVGSPDSKSAMEEAMVGDSAFKLRLHAPMQNTDDILASLDALLRIEESIRRIDEEDFVNQKQRLLMLHKNRIR